jgi:hypothetical protein
VIEAQAFFVESAGCQGVALMQTDIAQVAERVGDALSVLKVPPES